MSMTMEDDIKRWTAKRKAALVMQIIQGKTSISEASRAFDVSPAEIEEWVDEAKRGMENALRAKPLDIKEQYERQLKELQEAYGEAMLELRARKKYQALLLDKEENLKISDFGLSNFARTDDLPADATVRACCACVVGTRDHSEVVCLMQPCCRMRGGDDS